MVNKSIFGATGACVLSLIASTSQAATLQNDDILSFTSAAGSTVSGFAAGSAFDSATLDSLNGLIIGTAQPTFPDIDQQWMTTGVGLFGNHLTTSAVTAIDGGTLNFSGWVMKLQGEDYAFGATQGIADYTFDGTNFTLDYHWNAFDDNGGTVLGPLGVEVYDLHLVGTVSTVPVPAAVWLFGSGLLGLVGVARQKKA